MGTEINGRDQRLAYALLRMVVGLNLSMHGLTYALVYSVLLFLVRYNGWSLDACMNRGENRQAS